ncbi:protein maelstrom homolog isoform X2 [Pogonomyrmex barbatus]|uniref:Protein maelstrom homolog isoform X2 n=1 Tax=Pogonomyrmex barbatus TaxID=144034 RepID=A0A8N1S3F2_9HYME|nr:protein maelstrom homolog isoform X2 [Pogonomyrmex barbatus]
MPKNKSKNAFYFFMLDWKRRAEAQGRKFPNGLKDVQREPECNEEWQCLTKQEKGPYEAMAKNDKITSQISSKDKKTSYGESINMIEQKELEIMKFKKEMQENIKVIIKSAVNLNFLPKLKFCIVHVNYFFTKIVNNALEYFPAEYAFGVFSLENGIEEVHHAIVSTKIPLGYRREALETSANSHNIPVEYPGGETDFVVMYKKLVDFLDSRKLVDQYPYLYTTTTNMGAVQSLITKLSDAAQENKDQFKIYELESLFTHLANEAYKNRTDRDINCIPIYAGHIFTRYTYIFEKGFECHFHKYVDGGTEHCSKSVLQQWAWTLCDEFCEPLGVVMQPGVHKPKKSKTDISQVMTNLMSNLKVNDTHESATESKAILSMTGVSERHRLKVSSRTYQEEMRRRNESKPIQMIDYGKESANKPIDDPVNKLNKSVEEEDKCVPNYLNEKPLRPPNINKNIYALPVNDLSIDDEESFPPIGGRGVPIRSRLGARKLPLGKGNILLS